LGSATGAATDGPAVRTAMPDRKSEAIDNLTLFNLGLLDHCLMQAACAGRLPEHA
jgi:hypothetical protein